MKENTDPDNDAGKFRMCLLKLVYSYGRLVVLSYGFQHAFGKNNTDENPFLMRVSILSSDNLLFFHTFSSVSTPLKMSFKQSSMISVGMQR